MTLTDVKDGQGGFDACGLLQGLESSRAPQPSPEAIERDASPRCPKTPSTEPAGPCLSPIRLIGLNGEFEGKEWSFSEPFQVGSRVEPGLRISEPSVSRRHAHFWQDDSGWWLADLGSTNGTWLNGTRIGSSPVGPLRRSDMVQFARICLRVRSFVRPALPWSEQMLPSPWSFSRSLLRLGQPKESGPLTVFPLFAPTGSGSGVNYLLSSEAITSGLLSVNEVSSEGQVSELSVENKGDRRVLFLEGEELRGGRQNRVLNTSVLIPANSVLRVPVSCVEKGRWSRSVDSHTSTGTVSSSRIRHTLRTSVTQSLLRGRGHSSDQYTLWDDVQTQHDSLGISSPTHSMTDTIVERGDGVVNILRYLPYVEGSSGFVVAVGSKVVAIDMFDSANTCRQVWHRFLSGLAVDGLMAGAQTSAPSPNQIMELFFNARRASWLPVASVGEGSEFRAVSEGMAGTALLLDDVMVHGGLVF